MTNVTVIEGILRNFPLSNCNIERGSGTALGWSNGIRTVSVQLCIILKEVSLLMIYCVRFRPVSK